MRIFFFFFGLLFNNLRTFCILGWRATCYRKALRQYSVLPQRCCFFLFRLSILKSRLCRIDVCRITQRSDFHSLCKRNFLGGWKKMKARLPKQKENKKNEVHCMYILPDQSINKAKNIICGNSEAPFSWIVFFFTYSTYVVYFQCNAVCESLFVYIPAVSLRPSRYS